MRRALAAAGILALSALAVPGAPRGLEAQEMRFSGGSTLRYVGIRPLRLDSVPAAATEGDGVLRRSADGSLVRCTPGQASCFRYVSGATTGMIPAVQDLGVSVWGIGRGISVYGQIRAHADLGAGGAGWPLVDDGVDVLEAYAELDRARYRVRGGRHWRASGLGYFNFDGLSALYRADPRLSVEGYAGLSLVRGLNEPLSTEALASVESYVPEKRGALFGLDVRARPTLATSFSASYQRELRSDRGALYGERVALDGVARHGAAAVQFELDADVAGRQVNEARLRLLLPPVRRVSTHLQARRYRPYFELWTIWSVFTPVGFNEVGGGAAWRSSTGRAGVSASGARRVYDETDAALSFVELRDAGWYLALTADMEPDEAWRVSGSYAADLGFGAARGQGSARVERSLGAESHGALTLHAFQRSAELRVTEGTVLGASVDAALRLNARTRIGGALSVYRHTDVARDAAVDWSQWRGLLRLDWVVGPEPGAVAGSGGRP